MLGVLRRPQTKTVMMLGGENESLYANFFGETRDLVRIEISRIKKRRRFIAIAPFFIRKRVYREMQESVKFYLLLAQLPLGGNRAARRGWCNTLLGY